MLASTEPGIDGWQKEQDSGRRADEMQVAGRGGRTKSNEPGKEKQAGQRQYHLRDSGPVLLATQPKNQRGIEGEPVAQDGNNENGTLPLHLRCTNVFLKGICNIWGGKK